MLRFLSVFCLAVCLPVLAWTFVTKTPPLDGASRAHRISAPGAAQSTRFSPWAIRDRSTQPPFGLGSCRLSAKGDDADEEDADLFDVDGWEPDEEDIMNEAEEIGDLDDELDLDDVESSVAGLDEDDEDGIDYEDEDDMIDEEEEEEDEDIEEEGGDYDEDEENEDEDEDYDAEDDDIESYLKGDGGMDEKPPEGYSKWWEDYGFESREDFENNELFPGGMKGLVADRFDTPDEDFWDDEATMVPLEESEDDPEYNELMKDVVENSAKRQAAAEASADDSDKNFYEGELENELETIEELSDLLDDSIPNDTGEEEFTIDASELDGMDIEEELEGVTALIDDEPYVGANRTDIAGTGITDEEMEALDQSWKNINDSLEKEPWNKVAATQFDFNYSAYPKQYHYDMQQTAVEIESAGYDVFPWLKYDMAFNVSNLILASIKHNPDAPVILQHWYPQLMVCERYQHARDVDFDFTWDDVNNADMEELERYYYGFGYEEIPKKAPAETGMIAFEDADEQEVKMAAMEKWMLDVYNSEWDKKDFDDEDIKDEDNVYSDNFKMPQHPDLPSWDEAQEDVAGWKDEYGEDDELDEEGIAYRDMMGRSVDYTSAQDDDFQKNFRGHLIIACGNFEADLDDAELITTRMEKEFGNAIYTETKIYQHATPDDNVFEVWLESYEIDLLHSKRRAAMNVVGWEGKGELNEDRMDFLVKEIGKLTSDDARTSFRWTEEHVS
ncbi:unnamed protein product [Pseudo-nitzschia multistriata]|uniref:Flavodoxin-like domain-containing protein n=1 Tax=Pseudo-nitzschia multistriata TaxID=183589 RepID=A0A448Z280_9STRA|nr:unnamed protein product [Pseudo-nitzschia multistriata]